MSTHSLDIDDSLGGFDTPLLKPPIYFFFINLVCIALGLLIGIFGIVRSAGLSNSQQYLIGGVGYLLTAIVPLIFLQTSRSKHEAAKANAIENPNEPYDFYGGNELQGKMLKSVAAGLVCAFLPIWIFFSPLAEKFV